MQNRKTIIKPNRIHGARYAPESMPFVYCAACLTQVLKNSPEAQDIYQKIKESYNLPEIRSMFETLAQRAQPGEESVKELFTTNKDKKPFERLKIFIGNQYNKVLGDSRWFRKWGDIEKDKFNSKECKYWLGLVDELIKVGFNHKDNIKKGKYKVSRGKDNPLLDVILYRSLADYKATELAIDENGIVAMLDGKNIYDFSQVFGVKIGSRRQRRTMKRLKDFGYRLTHDNKINRIAETWYKCRIVYPSVEKYVYAESIKDLNAKTDETKILDIKNIEKEVKLCDDALGYTRR